MPMTQGRHTSDRAAFEVRAVAATSASYQYSDPFSVHYHNAFDVEVRVPTKGAVTSMTIKAQKSFDGVTWSDVDSDDDLAAGATSPSPYEATFVVAANDHVENIRFQRRGLWMRVGVIFDAADGTFEVDVLRVVD